MEQVSYNLLFRWFIGLSMDTALWDVTVFTKNRDRLLARQRARLSVGGAGRPGGRAAAVRQASGRWHADRGVGQRSRLSRRTRRPRNVGQGRWQGALCRAQPRARFPRRRQCDHRSRTDPAARLYRKAAGQPAKLCYLGHLLMENRNGLIVDAELTQATGWAERAAAEAMIEAVAPAGRVTLGADKAYDAAGHVANLRRLSRPMCRTPAAAAPPSTAVPPGAGLRRRPAHPQTDRGAIRLDQVRRRLPPGKTSRPRPRR